MTIDRMILAIAGAFVMLSVLLASLHHPYWLFFTFFVGFNLFQSAFSGFCPMVRLLKWAGFKTGIAFG